MNDEKIKELQAMIVILLKRIEELEGIERDKTSPSTYLKELRKESDKLLKYWY